ncbi:ribosome maturation factor RimM [Pectinatus sottacetonis]|uniref:ribosome maturation factor RimM n=1 Tax=Pectinatus sottacetonis TaxID=1002795 RepID=UPI0018C4AF2C|nr:ribosome maturation factor RimM [Pectinatus sottacetonis]
MEKLSKCATEEKLITIGKIGKPHGVKGELRVYPLTDFPERFTNLHEAYIDNTTINIISARYSNDFIIIKAESFDNREKAAAVTGKMLKIARCNVAPLNPGEYYAFDIIGLDVYNENGNFLGIITDIIKTGSNDVYITENPVTKQQILIPALKKVVTKIDIKNKRIDVIMPDEA